MLISLDLPDHPSWQTDPTYSPRVASVLIQAYQLIHTNCHVLSQYRKAWRKVERIRNAPMSCIQRQHVYYVSSLCLAAQSEYHEAIVALDKALEICVDLMDMRAFAEASYLHGSTNIMLLEYQQASIDFILALDALRDAYDFHQDATGNQDQILELHILIGLASSEFMQANRRLTWDSLQEAQKIIDHLHNRRSESALLAWLRAQQLRWNGTPSLALPQAIDAAEALVVSGPSENAGRIQTIVGEIALDLAETFDTSAPAYGRQAMLTLADPYIARALTVARAQEDEAGECQALLARTRFERVCHENHSPRAAIIQRVMSVAKEHHDSALLCQALLAMGHELTYQNQVASARHFFLEAKQSVATTSIKVFDAPAQRALSQLSEAFPG